MKFEFLKAYLFEKCAERVDAAISEKGLSNFKIYPTESKLIGKIRRCEIDPKRNPNLITPNTQKALVDVVKFTDKELLWGTDWEIENEIFLVFQNLVYDLVAEDSPYRLLLNEAFCSYVPFARYSAYCKILFEKNTLHPNVAEFYYENEIELLQCVDSFRDDAIAYIFLNCQPLFLNEYKKLIDRTTSYTRLDSTLRDWVEEHVLVLFSMFTPNNDSIGKRIENLLYSDNNLTLKLYETNNRNDCAIELLNRLHSATSEYIEALEAIQQDYPEYVSIY